MAMFSQSVAVCTLIPCRERKFSVIHFSVRGRSGWGSGSRGL